MKVKLSILNKHGFVQQHFEYNTTDDNTLLLSIDDNNIYFNSEGRLYVNTIEEIFAVKYINPNEYMGSALYFYTYATNDLNAKSIAMNNKDFINQINMQNFDKNNIVVIKPNTAIFDDANLGKVIYYEQDPLI
jgi:hypothetical protein